MLLLRSKPNPVPVDDKLSDTSDSTFSDSDDGRNGFLDDDDAVFTKTGIRLGNRVIDVHDTTRDYTDTGEQVEGAAAAAGKPKRKGRK